MIAALYALLHMSCYQQSCQIVVNMIGAFVQPMIVNLLNVPPIV